MVWQRLNIHHNRARHVQGIVNENHKEEDLQMQMAHVSGQQGHRCLSQAIMKVVQTVASVRARALFNVILVCGISCCDVI